MRNEWSGKMRDINSACCQSWLDTPHITKEIWGIRLPHRNYIRQRASPYEWWFIQSIFKAHSMFIHFEDELLTAKFAWHTNLIYIVYNFILNTLDSKISVLGVNGFKKNHYLCGRFRNSKNEMQQNRMNITATNICRGSKGFEGMLYAPMSSILTFDNIGNTIQLKYTRTRIL